MKFPIVRQYDAVDCGPACLKMIATYYGKDFSMAALRERSHITRLGVSLRGIAEAAESIGFRTTAVRINFEGLRREAPFPSIVHWDQNHFVVVYKIKKDKIFVADPNFGRVVYRREEFERGFADKDRMGTVLFLYPTPKFHDLTIDSQKKSPGFLFLFSYIKNYSAFLLQLFLGLLAGSLILLITPFLTQALVDVGINRQDMNFVYVILIAQLMLFLGNSSIEIIRSRILLHIGTRVNVSILSDFLMKLLKLPMSFFNSRMLGDILQRIEDHDRIQKLLTATTLNTLFSLMNILIFGIVLFIYKAHIFVIFFLGSTFSIHWVVFFLKKRRILDFKSFSKRSLIRSRLIQLIQGVEEIKISNSDRQKRWEWEELQARLFKLDIRSLNIRQMQQIGSSLITQLKNIIISIIAAKAVIDGGITLGSMMAITFIIGQLNGPIEQILDFLLTLQDARLGLERISEISIQQEEDAPGESKIIDIPGNKDIILKNISFAYDGSESNRVLTNLNLVIPAGKKTAVVGVSGSGKTTLMKLILKFFQPQEGDMLLGNINFSSLHGGRWREKCGVVLQDGYLFSDTIAKNVALGDEVINYRKIEKALKIANIDTFVAESLPLRFMTKIGDEGLKLSRGQSQRLLLARAIYKEPDYIFLDEATSFLDANNERIIMNNLDEFFRGKTVLVIAHRLSTVKDADLIVVIDKGKIVEQGQHKTLTQKRGFYYRLVRNQLELGK